MSYSQPTQAWLDKVKSNVEMDRLAVLREKFAIQQARMTRELQQAKADREAQLEGKLRDLAEDKYQLQMKCSDMALENEQLQQQCSSLKESQEKQSYEETLRCPICFDSLFELKRDGKVLASTTCGHLFCMEDIQTAVDQMNLCPTCSTPLTSHDVHPVYLT